MLAAQAVLGERQLGVALGQLAQAPLVAALGDADLDAEPRRLVSASLSSVGAAGELGADDDRGGTAGEAA